MTAAPSSSLEARANAMLRRALDAFEGGEVEEAVGGLCAIADLGIEPRGFHLLAALCLLQRKEVEGAKVELERELALFPGDLGAAGLLGSLLKAEEPDGSAAQSGEEDFESEAPEGKIDLFITAQTRCNYRCVFCSNPSVDPRQLRSMPLEDIKGFLESMGSRARMVDITGWGEISIHPEFEQILECISRTQAKIRMVTNGSHLTEQVTDAIARANMGQIIVSVNSLNPDTYLRLHQKPLAPVLEGIERLHRKLRNPRVLSFSFVVTSWNLPELKDFIDFGARYRTHVACLGLTPTLKDYYQEGLQVKPTPENLAWIEEAKAYALRRGVSFWITPHETRDADGVQPRQGELSERIKQCRWVYTKFFVGLDGKVGPCCWSKHVLGDARLQSFEEIWEGEAYRDLRERILRGDLTYCKDCGAY